MVPSMHDNDCLGPWKELEGGGGDSHRLPQEEAPLPWR